MEKLVKRAKPFLDEKLKSKLRIKALYSALEPPATDLEISKFFELNDNAIFNVTNDYFAYRTSKLPALKEGLLLTRDGQELMEILAFYHKILKYCKPQIKLGWQKPAICSEN